MAWMQTLYAMEHHVWDGFMAFLTFAGGNTMAIFTVIRCRNRWQFVLIAVWKICLSSTLSLTAFTNAVFLSNKGSEDIEFLRRPLPSIYWLFLYLLGLIVGMVGVFSLVKETWPDNSQVKLITYVFGGISGGCIAVVMVLALVGAILVVVLCVAGEAESVDLVNLDSGVKLFFGAAPFGGVIFLVTLGVFYSDWILAAIAGNLAGEPSSDIALFYWLYFAFKRLPLFSF